MNNPNIKGTQMVLHYEERIYITLLGFMRSFLWWSIRRELYYISH
jgi:hypothetical protein